MMNYIYKYEDSMRKCETLLEENLAKLCKYSKCLRQSSSSSSSEFAERDKEYDIIKKKLYTAQENIATLKSEYNDLTLYSLRSNSFENNLKEKFFNYLTRQEQLRLKFIETINECKQINSNLNNILCDCSNEALNKNSIQNASQHSEATQSCSNRADGLRLKPFECADCSKSFARKHDMKSHVFSIHMPYQSRPYKCDTCSKFYSSQSNLNYHRCSASARRKTVSDRRQSPVCNICGKHFSLGSDLKRHVLIHEGLKPFKCEECGNSFRTKYELDRHTRRCHLPYHTRPYNCDVCGKRYAAQFHLNAHKRLVGHYCSSKLPKFTSADVDNGVTVKEHVSNTVLGAKKVGKFKLVSSKRKKKSNSSNFFVCNICDQKLSRRSHLKSHMMLHEASKSKPFKCAECDKSFVRKETMRQHIVLMHINDQRSLFGSHYYCAHCKYRCQSKESLVYHIKENHISNLSVNEFSCTVCGKTFTTMGNRAYHERWAHVGKKCFCCTKCGNRYKYASGLAQHLRLKQCMLK